MVVSSFKIASICGVSLLIGSLNLELGSRLKSANSLLDYASDWPNLLANANRVPIRMRAHRMHAQRPSDEMLIGN
jgi:hypothetical protein